MEVTRVGQSDSLNMQGTLSDARHASDTAGLFRLPVYISAAVFLLFFWAFEALAQPQVDSVRLGVHPDKTRFVLEISEEPPYRVFTLPDPYRVVIDLPQVDWRVSEEAVRAQSAGNVDALRFGLFSQGTSRVVLDATAPVAVKSVFIIPPRDGQSYRLVVDLEEIPRATFMERESRRAVLSDKPMPEPERRDVQPAPSGDRRPTVVVDPGHGGVDPGAIGVSGTYEKDLVLDYSLALRDMLKETGRYRVVMTRDDDVFLRLRDRVAVAEEAGGDLFVSLHANTHSSSQIRGASVFTLSETASDSEAAALAAKENRADIIAGVNLGGQTDAVSSILIDLMQRDTMNASKHFANTLVTKLDGQEVTLLNNTHRFAGFAVLKSPSVPSILFEIGYMTNAQEEQRLKTPAHRERVNRAMVRAIDGFFEWQEARDAQ